MDPPPESSQRSSNRLLHPPSSPTYQEPEGTQVRFDDVYMAHRQSEILQRHYKQQRQQREESNNTQSGPPSGHYQEKNAVDRNQKNLDQDSCDKSKVYTFKKHPVKPSHILPPKKPTPTYNGRPGTKDPSNQRPLASAASKRGGSSSNKGGEASKVHYTPEQMDARALEKLKFLKARMEEWEKLDYIPDEDIETIDTETLRLGGELLHTNPEKFSKLNKYDATAPGQSGWDLDGADDDGDDDDKEEGDANTDKREEEGGVVENRRRRKLGEDEVSFSAFINQKKTTWNGSTNLASGDDTEMGYNISNEVRKPVDNKVQNLDQESSSVFIDNDDPEPESTETKALPRNIIRIEDPDDFLVRPSAGTFKPDIKPEFLAPGMISDDNPGQFLSKKSFMGFTSVKNLQQFLNKYRLNKESDYWSERELMRDFCDDMRRYTVELQSVTREPSSMKFIFLVELPLFVYCVFKRAQNREKRDTYFKPGEKDIPVKKRKYSWAGYRLAMGKDSEAAAAAKEKKDLPPSSFKFNPPSSTYNGELDTTLPPPRPKSMATHPANVQRPEDGWM